MKCKGYSLLEIVIILLISSIILTFAASFSRSYFAKMEFEKVDNDVSYAIYFSRLHAMLEAQNITLQPIDANWKNGIKAMYKNKVLRKWHWKLKYTNLSWQGFRKTPQFSNNNFRANGHFLIENIVKTEKIIVNRLGRFRKVYLK